MKAQTPAEGISVEQIFKDAKVFNVECQCGSDDHAVKMWIELNSDSDSKDIEVTFYVDTYTAAFNGWASRLKAVYNIIFKGVHKQQHSVILSKQAAINFSAAIAKTIKELEQKR